MGCRRLAIFAILMGTVFAETNAGATTLGSEQEEHGPGQTLERGMALHGSWSGESASSGIAVAPPPLQLFESSLTWIGDPAPQRTSLDTLGTPEKDTPKSKISNGVAASSQNGNKQGSGEVNFRSKGPALQSDDLLSWKSTGDTPPANPEDWLFRLQYSKASSYQAPDPNPPFPIPEPASSTLMLMGLAGILAWRRRA